MRGRPSETPAPSDPVIARVLRPFQQFIATEAASGVVLLMCTALALGWANSPWADSYHRVWESGLALGMGSVRWAMPVRHWVNDGLMTVFFFLVGLEIKREVLTGDLSNRRSATLPIAAALGGMLVPAALYSLVNFRGAGSAGWGVPMATDIAFALGILSLLGRRAPSSLRVFLAALAIADDLGAVLVIALFYSGALDWPALGGATGIFALLFGLNVAGVRRPVVWALLGIVLWAFVLRSGIHPTIAGVLLALSVPASSLLERFEHALKAPVAFVIMPIFALANAGVALGTGAGPASRSAIAWGVILGLVLGKPIGITLASYVAVRTGAADLPAGSSWAHIHGAAWLGGIGFTMSLFIAGLAFGPSPSLDIAKLGVLVASATAGVVGSALLWRASRAASGPAAGDRL